MNLPVLSFRQAKLLARTAIQARRSLMIYGAYGIGKSALPKEIARELGWPCVTINCPQIDPIDLRGIPHVGENGATRWAPPWFMKPSVPHGLIFLDELTSAVPAVMVAGMQLFLEQRVGDAELPAGWHVIAAGNTAADQTIAYDLPAPARNRMIQISMHPMLDEWVDWAQAHEINPQIISFLKSWPDGFFKRPPKGQLAFPTPRAWHILSDMMKAITALSDSERREVLSNTAHGLIGTEAAERFLDALGGITRLSVPEIRSAPDTCRLPDSTEIASVLSALAAAAHRDHMFTDVRFLQRLSKEHRVLFVGKLQGALKDEYKRFVEM